MLSVLTGGFCAVFMCGSPPSPRSRCTTRCVNGACSAGRTERGPARSSTVFTAARWYKGEALHLDPYARGLLKTWMADSVITDSAAAGTAFATGYKTSDGFVGVGPRTDTTLSTFSASEELAYRPLATVLEGAKLMGKATGIVATSRVTHATPAAFGSHIHDRGLDNEIMEHLVYNDIDVVFGGGKRHLLPVADGGKRTDGENLVQVLLDRGFEFVETRDDMLALDSGRAWGMFASSHMLPDIDRAEFGPDEPSLAEMTAKAIELLNQDPDGFFLMVEGSQIDWAGHNNDPFYMVTDTLAFDDAFKAAIDFAKADGDTMVIVFPDHNTGAMAIGHNFTAMGYTETTVEDLIAPLEGMRLTSAGVATKIAEAVGGGTVTAADVIAGVSEWWGIDLSDGQADEILDLTANAGLSLNYAIATVVSRDFTVFGWTTYGHSGEDVPLWSYGRYKPVGTIDNTQIAVHAARGFGFDLDLASEFLFVDLGDYFPGYTVDDTDPANPVIRVGSCAVPISKDYMEIGGFADVEIPLPVMAVHAPVTDKVYVPMTAIALMQAFEGTAATAATSSEEVQRRIHELTKALRVAPEHLEGLR